MHTFALFNGAAVQYSLIGPDILFNGFGVNILIKSRTIDTDFRNFVIDAATKCEITSSFHDKSHDLFMFKRIPSLQSANFDGLIPDRRKR